MFTKPLYLLVDFIFPFLAIPLLIRITARKAKIDANKILKNEPEWNIILDSEDFNVNSSSESDRNKIFILIGQSKEYYFFHHRESCETTVLKSEKIKTLKFRASKTQEE